ncbi:6-bladed beta-propeller [Anseongella ginsenosidimutans]|nr:6-bladed beta-propeller [Anseongella ginsenosidimutans]
MSQQQVTLRVDPHHAHGGAASDVFEEINYIPLESTKESLFQRIDQLLVTDDYFIILDRIGNSILIFDKNGKFHRRLDGLPGAEKVSLPRMQFKAISVDPVKKQLVVTRPHFMTEKIRQDGRTVFYFDFNGNFIKKHTYSFYFRDFCSIGQEKILFSVSPPGLKEFKAGQFFRLGYYQSDSVLYKNELLHKRGRDGADETGTGRDLSFNPATRQAMYNDSFQYTLHVLDSIGLQRTYRFIFPLANSLPADFTSNEKYDGSRIQFIKEQPSPIIDIFSAYTLNDYLLFGLFSMREGDYHWEEYIYNSRSGNLLSYSRIHPDSLSFFLPVYDSRILACDKGYVYGAVTSPKMYSYHAKNSRRNVDYPSELKEFFLKADRLANPVIIQLKPKKGL